jgi:hypothetical protein
MNLEDRITEALRAPVAIEARTALDLRVRAAIEAMPPRRARRTWVVRGLVLAGLLAIAVPGAIAAGIFFTENPLGLADAGEYAAEIEAAKEIVPLPAGRTWPGFLRPEDPNGSYSRGGGLPTVEAAAMCIWFDEWLDAREAADPGRESAAAETIAGIPSWASWDSAFYDQSYRDHFGPIIAAVGRGDARPVEREMGLNCSWVSDE